MELTTGYKFSKIHFYIKLVLASSIRLLSSLLSAGRELSCIAFRDNQKGYMLEHSVEPPTPSEAHSSSNDVPGSPSNLYEPLGDDDVSTSDENTPLNKRNWTFQRHNSVILPETGERVQRSMSFTNSNFQSFNMNGEELFLADGNEQNSSWSTYTQQIKTYYDNEMCRKVLKCSIAYTIASLAVYWGRFDLILGKSDSKHLVATVAVYFHPLRSKGSMHQTLLFVVVSLLFSFLVSFACRMVSHSFFNSGQDEVSYSIDLVVSSVSLGIVAYMKQKVNKQTFNTACSLASIAIVACIVKEGSMNAANIPIERLTSTLRVVLVGCAISVLVCYIIWPVSATDELRSHLNDSYNIMSSLLSIVTNRFLSCGKKKKKDSDMFDLLKKNISLLNASREESRYELFALGRELEWKVLNQLVTKTIALARHLQALRSSNEMQWELLHDSNQPLAVASLTSYRISEMPSKSGGTSTDEVMDSTQLFELFVHTLAPSTKSFLFTIKSILSEVPFEDFHEDTDTRFTNTVNYQHSLRSAVALFEDKQQASFERIYSQDVFKSSQSYLFRTNVEEVTACCGNFASILTLFARELQDFLVVTQTYEESRTGPRSWSWIRQLWSLEKGGNSTVSFMDVLEQRLNYSVPAGEENESRWGYYFWSWFRAFKRVEVQFGIRVGLGAFVLSLLAFYPPTKQKFINWRGEWSLTIYCIMMNKSLGGTTMTVKWRFIGTFLGACSAYLVWMISEANGYALAFIGFLISLPSFYIIQFWKKNNPFGRFILLTYNLTALYSYGMLQHDSEDGQEGGEDPIVGEIAFHRFISVSGGVLWALIMASCFLPNSARSRLKSAITLLWLRMGIMWDCGPLGLTEEVTNGVCLRTLVGLKDIKGMAKLLGECETLLKQAPIEFRLKGTFPKQTYEGLLRHTSSILNAFENIHIMIMAEPQPTENEVYVLDYIQQELQELQHRIYLIFFMLASSIKLGLPPPSKPASTEHAHDRMLHKLSEIRINSLSDSQLKLKNSDYVLLYSYILVASTITMELDNILVLVQQLVGQTITDEVLQLV